MFTNLPFVCIYYHSTIATLPLFILKLFQLSALGRYTVLGRFNFVISSLEDYTWIIM